jgi:hypothetical protein
MAGRSGTLSKGRELIIMSFQERVQQIQEEDGLDCDPIRVLMEIATGKKKNKKGEYVDIIGGWDEDGNPVILDSGVRQKAAAELCSYLYPKRKAIEVSGKVDTPIQFAIIPDMTPLPTMEDALILDGSPSRPPALPAESSTSMYETEPRLEKNES